MVNFLFVSKNATQHITVHVPLLTRKKMLNIHYCLNLINMMNTFCIDAYAALRNNQSIINLKTTDKVQVLYFF